MIIIPDHPVSEMFQQGKGSKIGRRNSRKSPEALYGHDNRAVPAFLALQLEGQMHDPVFFQPILISAMITLDLRNVALAGIYVRIENTNFRTSAPDIHG